MIAVHSKVIRARSGRQEPGRHDRSHNFSDRASTKNDDNLVIIRAIRSWR